MSRSICSFASLVGLVAALVLNLRRSEKGIYTALAATVFTDAGEPHPSVPPPHVHRALLGVLAPSLTLPLSIAGLRWTRTGKGDKHERAAPHTQIAIEQGRFVPSPSKTFHITREKNKRRMCNQNDSIAVRLLNSQAPHLKNIKWNQNLG